MTRPQSVKVLVEGRRAEAATRDLFSKGWFEAEWEGHADERSVAPDSVAPGSAAPASVVSAQVLAIAGGSVTIADKMLGWWETWRKAEGSESGASRLAVVLEAPTGARVSLEDASRDALVEVLRVLHAPAR